MFADLGRSKNNHEFLYSQSLRAILVNKFVSLDLQAIYNIEFRFIDFPTG